MYWSSDEVLLNHKVRFLNVLLKVKTNLEDTNLLHGLKAIDLVFMTLLRLKYHIGLSKYIYIYFKMFLRFNIISTMPYPCYVNGNC